MYKVGANAHVITRLNRQIAKQNHIKRGWGSASVCKSGHLKRWGEMKRRLWNSSIMYKHVRSLSHTRRLTHTHGLDRSREDCTCTLGGVRAQPKTESKKKKNKELKWRRRREGRRRRRETISTSVSPQSSTRRKTVRNGSEIDVIRDVDGIEDEIIRASLIAEIKRETLRIHHQLEIRGRKGRPFKQRAGFLSIELLTLVLGSNTEAVSRSRWLRERTACHLRSEFQRTAKSRESETRRIGAHFHRPKLLELDLGNGLAFFHSAPMELQRPLKPRPRLQRYYDWRCHYPSWLDAERCCNHLRRLLRRRARKRGPIGCYSTAGRLFGRDLKPKQETLDYSGFYTNP